MSTRSTLEEFESSEILDLTEETVLDLTTGTVSSRPQLSLLTNPTVTVVVPTLNEAKNLPHVFGELRKIEMLIHEVLIVDGYSTDDTVEVALAEWPTARVVTQSRRGKGNALKHGFDAATGDIIVMLDADGSADPGEIPRFVEALTSGADFAKGTRFALGGGSSDITPLRRAGNWGLNALTNTLYRTKFTDLCYGYNAFWAHCLPYIDVDCDGFEVETLINCRVAKAGLVIEEVGSFEADRIFGTSNLNTFRDGWRVLRTLLKERFIRTPKAERLSTVSEEAVVLS